MVFMRNFTFQPFKGKSSISLSALVIAVLLFSNSSASGQIRLWDVVSTAHAPASSITQPASYSSTPGSSTAHKLMVKKEAGTVLISWTGSGEETISHYILETGNKGKDYRQAAVFFTGETLSETMTYRFSQKLKKGAVPAFRLKVVGKDGSLQTIIPSL